MNGRQRILSTIAGQPVDRPALAPFLHVNFIKEHRRDNTVDPVVETIAVYDEFGFDLIHRNCTPVYDDFTIEGPDWTPSVSEVGDAAKKPERDPFDLHPVAAGDDRVPDLVQQGAPDLDAEFGQVVAE